MALTQQETDVDSTKGFGLSTKTKNPRLLAESAPIETSGDEAAELRLKIAEVKKRKEIKQLMQNLLAEEVEEITIDREISDLKTAYLDEQEMLVSQDAGIDLRKNLLGKRQASLQARSQRVLGPSTVTIETQSQPI